MLLLATLLLLPAGGLMLLLVLAERRTGPEGPVGFHLVTGPMAIGQAASVGLALAAGSLAGTGWFATVVGIALPGYVVAATVLPVVGLSGRWRPLAVAGSIAAVGGCVGVLLGAEWVPAAGVPGGVLVAATGAGGYGLLLAMWWEMEANRVRSSIAATKREEEWRTEQSAWQLGEWQKLPAEPEMFQLIQFVNAMHPEVHAQCHAKIAALPDLDARMDALLRTGWAEHALSFVARDYPRSRAALAPALAEFLDAKFPEWESRLREAELPHTWSGNVSNFVEVIRATIADGGDLRAQAAQWRTLLREIKGLSHYARELEVA